jgi:hypothetical protein
MPRADREEIQQALAEAADQLEEDLREVFGFEQVQAHRETDPEPSLVVTGPEGRFELAWPPTDGLTEAEGRLGAHARIAFELWLASHRPEAFFDGYRPVSEDYRDIVFSALKAYIDDSLGENPYYAPLTFVQRGPVVLVYGDDEYALIADDGSHEGSGILRWKVKRLAAFALTDADAERLEAD